MNKMNGRKYIKLLCLILLSGCGQVKSDKDDYTRIDLPLSREENMMNLSEVVDSIQYIPLETHDECLIGNVDKLIPTSDDCFLVVDKDIASSVYLFDQNGSFLRKIGTKGIGKGEYVTIEDVVCDSEYIYIWDSSSKRVLKYSMKGDYVSSLAFDYVAYSMSCIDGGKFAFCCDYAPNGSLRVDDKLPSLLILEENSGKVDSDLFFESTISNFGYDATLNNLCNNNLYLPLNDTIYHVTNSGVERKYVLQYAKQYLDNKNAYVEKTKTPQMSQTDVGESTEENMYPQLITYFDCDGVDVFFMRMGGFLYYGFYYPSTDVYKEAAANEKFPIINDIDGVVTFSPRNSKKNIIYSIMDAAKILEKQGSIPPLKGKNTDLNEDSNPVLVKMYMKRSV